MAVFNGDDFTIGTSAYLEAHTPAGANAHGSGAWSNLIQQVTSGTEQFPWVWSSNFLRILTSDKTHDNSGVGTGWARRLDPIADSADCSIKIKVTAVESGSVNTPFFLLLRVADANNWYGMARYRTGATPTDSCKIVKMVSGTPSDISTDNFNISVNDTFTLEAVGTALKVYHNDVEVTNLSTTDSSITAAGYFGVGAGSLIDSGDIAHSSWNFDDLICTTEAAGGSSVASIVTQRHYWVSQQ